MTWDRSRRVNVLITGDCPCRSTASRTSRSRTGANASPITDDYPGDPQYRFTGGTINRVAIDVSGEPYLDLEREAELMLMRE
jgi:hypothetical protein